MLHPAYASYLQAKISLKIKCYDNIYSYKTLCPLYLFIDMDIYKV